MSYNMTHTLLIVKGPEAQEFNQGHELNLGNWRTILEYNLYNMKFMFSYGDFAY